VEKGFAMVLMNYYGANKAILEYGMDMTWYPDGSKIIYMN
jgi:hypothetical protein